MNAGDGKIKILHIITRLEFGGPPLSLLDLIARLDKEKFDVSLATGFTPDPERDMIEEARELEIEVFTVPSLVRDVRVMQDLRALWQLSQIIRKGSYHIVHCHTSKAGFIGPLAAKLAGARCVLYSPHGTILHGYFGRLKTRFFILLQRFAPVNSLSARILAFGLKSQGHKIIEIGCQVKRQIHSGQLVMDFVFVELLTQFCPVSRPYRFRQS